MPYLIDPFRFKTNEFKTYIYFINRYYNNVERYNYEDGTLDTSSGWPYASGPVNTGSISKNGEVYLNKSLPEILSTDGDVLVASENLFAQSTFNSVAFDDEQSIYVDEIFGTVNAKFGIKKVNSLGNTVWATILPSVSYGGISNTFLNTDHSKVVYTHYYYSSPENTGWGVVDTSTGLELLTITGTPAYYKGVVDSNDRLLLCGNRFNASTSFPRGGRLDIYDINTGSLLESLYTGTTISEVSVDKDDNIFVFRYFNFYQDELVKLNSLGVEQWVINLGATTTERMRSLFCNIDGSVVITYSTASYPPNYSKISKFDSSGTLLYTIVTNDINTNIGPSIDLTPLPISRY